MPINKICFDNHMGFLCVELAWFKRAYAEIQSGRWRILSPLELEAKKRDAEPSGDEPPYQVTKDGVALISLSGPLQKGFSKYGGTSTIAARQQIRDAVTNSKVTGIMVGIDSPGGYLAGTAELADDIAAAGAVKPVHAHIDDLGASAAYWAASQAQRITANRTAEVGSIGTFHVIEDSSKAYDEAGVKVHVISTAKWKGMGVDGTEITPEHLAYLQERADKFNAHFKDAVVKGRGFDAMQIKAVSDGKVWMAEDARQMGLIDSVESFDAAVANLAKVARSKLDAAATDRTPALDRAAAAIRLREKK
jgi:signal peptide peptidase SppA